MLPLLKLLIYMRFWNRLESLRRGNGLRPERSFDARPKIFASNHSAAPAAHVTVAALTGQVQPSVSR